MAHDMTKGVSNPMGSRSIAIVTSQPSGGHQSRQPAICLARMLDARIYSPASFTDSRAPEHAALSGVYTPGALAKDIAAAGVGTTIALNLDIIPELPRAGSCCRLLVVVPFAESLAKLSRLDFEDHQGRIDHLVLQNPWHHLYALERLSWPAERLELIPPGVDHDFFTPGEAAQDRRQVVVPAFTGMDLAGLAASGMGREVGGKVVVSSTRAGSFGADLGTSWEVVKTDEEGLRGELQRAGAVLIPVSGRESGAGADALLEAMACGAPIVAARTWGLEHLVADEHEGVFYTPGDFGTARGVLRRLLAAPEDAAALGRSARHKVEHGLSLSHWAARVARVATSVYSKPVTQFFHIAAHGRSGIGAGSQ